MAQLSFAEPKTKRLHNHCNNRSKHPTEELQALLSLFDGEIVVTEKETAEGQQKTMRIKRLYNQKYSKDEVSLQEH